MDTVSGRDPTGQALVQAPSPAVSAASGFDPSRFKLEWPTSELVARALWSATYAAYSLCLSGHTWPDKEERQKRMTNPRAGDLVVESGGGLREAHCANAVGWLLKETREPVWTAEQLAEMEGGDEPVPDERVFYIQTLEGVECRWVNCSFLAVPESEGWWTYERQFARDRLRARDTHRMAETEQLGAKHE